VRILNSLLRLNTSSLFLIVTICFQPFFSAPILLVVRLYRAGSSAIFGGPSCVLFSFSPCLLEAFVSLQQRLFFLSLLKVLPFVFPYLLLFSHPVVSIRHFPPRVALIWSPPSPPPGTRERYPPRRNWERLWSFTFRALLPQPVFNPFFFCKGVLA